MCDNGIVSSHGPLRTNSGQLASLSISRCAAACLDLPSLRGCAAQSLPAPPDAGPIATCNQCVSGRIVTRCIGCSLGNRPPPFLRDNQFEPLPRRRRDSYRQLNLRRSSPCRRKPRPVPRRRRTSSASPALPFCVPSGMAAALPVADFVGRGWSNEVLRFLSEKVVVTLVCGIAAQVVVSDCGGDQPGALKS